MGEFARKDIVLTFGLINATVRLTGAVEADTTPRLNTLCVGTEKGAEHPPVAVKQQYTCATCGPLTDKAVLKKGKPAGDGFVLVDAEQVANVRSESGDAYKKQVKFTAHPAGQVLDGTAPNGTLYYLAPQTAGASEAYGLLRDLIAAHPEVAFVALYTVSSRVGMYVARVHDGAIVLEGRHRGSDLKAAPQIETEANEALFGMAEQFLTTMVTEFDADTYADSYTARLAEMLNMATPVAGLPSEETAPKSIDLMAALQAELAKAAS